MSVDARPLTATAASARTSPRRNRNAVAVLSLSAGQGGCRNHLMAVTEEMIRRGMEVHLLTSTEGEPGFADQFEKVAGRPALRLAGLNPGLHPEFERASPKAAAAALRAPLDEIMPGRLHLHSTDELSQDHLYPALRDLLAHEGDLVPPMLQTIHDALAAELPAGPQDLGIFVSRYLSVLHANQPGWEPHSQRWVIPPGVDGLYRPGSLLDPEIEALPRPVEMVSGRPVDWKNIGAFIIAQAIKRSRRDWKGGTAVYTHPPLDQDPYWRAQQLEQIGRWKKLARAFGFELVVFERTHEQLVASTRSADLAYSYSGYIQPRGGPRHTEPYGLVGPQARAVGTPALVGADGGPREAIPPELYPHVLVEMDDPADLADKSARLLNDPALYAMVRDVGQAHTLENLGVERITDRILEAYEEAERVAANRPRQPA